MGICWEGIRASRISQYLCPMRVTREIIRPEMPQGRKASSRTADQTGGRPRPLPARVSQWQKTLADELPVRRQTARSGLWPLPAHQPPRRTEEERGSARSSSPSQKYCAVVETGSRLPQPRRNKRGLRKGRCSPNARSNFHRVRRFLSRICCLLAVTDPSIRRAQNSQHVSRSLLHSIPYTHRQNRMR